MALANRPAISGNSFEPALPKQNQRESFSAQKSETASAMPLRSEVVPSKLAAPSGDIVAGGYGANEVRAGMKPLLETDIPVQNNTPQKETVRNDVNKKATADTVRKEVVSSVGSASSQVCTDAKPEVDKAEKAQDVGDKLFHYRRALRICPDDADTHVKIGDLYLSLGRKEDALFEYEEAKKLNSNFPGITEKIESAR
jgi:tetratricopeptide (TPR) repeat protein